MRGFANNSNPSTPAGVGGASPGMQQTPATPIEEPNRPEIEALTPPGFPKPPPREPAPELDLDARSNDSATEFNAQIPLPAPPVVQQTPESGFAGAYGGAPSYRRGSMGSGSAKKRKLNDGDEFAAMGDDGLDADVAEMLRQDSGTV
jgi:regulator of Ty1 transposition protein 103